MNWPIVDLSIVTARLAKSVAPIQNRTPRPELICARWADHCRDAGLRPLPASQQRALTESLDEEGWRRLALQVSIFDDSAVRNLLPELVRDRDLPGLFRDGLVWNAIDKSLLTMDLLRRSALRVEEFARHFAAAMRLQIAGETPLESARKRHRLDYFRLTVEVEYAAKTVEETLEEQRELQMEHRRRDKLLMAAHSGFDAM